MTESILMKTIMSQLSVRTITDDDEDKHTCTLDMRTNTDGRKHDDEYKQCKLNKRSNKDDRKHDQAHTHLQVKTNDEYIWEKA